MILRNEDINRGKLTHLIAEDMFYKGDKLVFSAKTGKHIGYIYNGYQVIEEEPEQQQPEQKPKDPSQLKLF